MNTSSKRPRRRWTEALLEERGTALVMAVVAMLLLAIMVISFTTLGDLEARIGFNDVREKQAAMIAEAGINAVRNQVQNPPTYTALLGHEYECTPSACTCTGAGCGVARLASVSTGTFRVRVENDSSEADPTVDTNQRVMLTAVGTTADGRGRARIRAWLTNDDPWKHVCSSGDGVLCTDPPNNQNADITPDDPNDMNGPRTYPEIPVPNNIRTTPVVGAAINVGAPNYPVPAGVTIPGAPWGPSVMYPYYLTALTTACTQCSPATIAYDPANPTCTNAATGAECLGMVRLETGEVRIQSNSGGPSPKMVVPGGQLGTTTAPATVYSFGKLYVKNGVPTVIGTLVLHGGADAGSGGSATDLHFEGPHTVTAQACAGCPTSYPLAILAYNPNEPAPPSQTIFLDISNNGVIINGIVYTGGTVDFGPNSVNGAVMGYTVNANNASTAFTYGSVYEPALPPSGFSTPAVTLPSVIARGTWLQCQRADSLTAVCD